MFQRILAILLLVLFGVYSCDAPRLNPLDPQNPDYVSPAVTKSYTISGSIKIKSSPLTPVANTDVYWANENKLVRSDNNGDFILENLKPNDGWLFFEKSGYLNDSSYVSWEEDTLKVVDKFLEPVPVNSITGNVKTQASPSMPLAGVNVYWRNEQKLIQTDQSGNFAFTDVEKKDGWLFFDKDGFFEDSVQVIWNSSNTVNVQRFLTYTPTATYFSIYTEIENDYAKNTYKIGFETEIVDKDQIVDSVIIENSELKIYQPLTRQTFSKYGNIYKIGNLGLPTLQYAAGREFNLVFIDTAGQKRIVAAKEKINRIITEEILFKTPFNRDTVSTTPILEWHRPQGGFNFHYLVQVLTFEQVPVIVFEKNNISSEDIRVQVSPPIDNSVNGVDEYNWVIWSIDEFNNKSRSKPASFIVK